MPKNESNKQPALNHSYDVNVVLICLMIKLKTSASFRAIQKIILIMCLNARLNSKAPSHTTILNWTKKFGFHQLQKPRDLSGKWFLIIDESIQFGQNKLLVIYGVRIEDIDFTRPLNFHDLVPFKISSATNWKGEAIYNQIREINEKVGEIAYVVADGGNSIKKALDLAGIPHVYDLTHYIAMLLNHIYSEDKLFQAYTRQISWMRGSHCLSKIAHTVPPALRSHSRFMNLKPISDWGVEVLNLLDHNNQEAFGKEIEALKWVADYRSFIYELDHLNKKINEIEQKLKSEGISKTSVKETKQIMEKFQSPRLQKFQSELNSYLDRMEACVADDQSIHCSSDIIESTFGKYKNYIHGNPMIGFTDLSLSIGAFTGNLEEEEVKNALELNATKEIKNWGKTNIAETAFSKRKKTLKWGETVN